MTPLLTYDNYFAKLGNYLQYHNALDATAFCVKVVVLSHYIINILIIIICFTVCFINGRFCNPKNLNVCGGVGLMWPLFLIGDIYSLSGTWLGVNNMHQKHTHAMMRLDYMLKCINHPRSNCWHKCICNHLKSKKSMFILTFYTTFASQFQFWHLKWPWFVIALIGWVNLWFDPTTKNDYVVESAHNNRDPHHQN